LVEKTCLQVDFISQTREDSVGLNQNRKIMTRKNNLIRSIAAVLTITFMSTGLVLAQPSGNQGPPPVPSDKQITKMVKELDKELDLSDEQSEQVSELYFAHFAEVESLQKSSSRPSRSVMEKLDESFEVSVKEVLNEEQQEQYTSWLKEQEQQRSKQRPQGGQRPPR